MIRRDKRGGSWGIGKVLFLDFYGGCMGAHYHYKTICSYFMKYSIHYV